jgi:TP901 family phage tail tape measure protein
VAISTRELYLILRARDEASRVLRSAAGNINGMGAASQAAAQRHIAQGQALVTVGVGFAAAGAAGLAFFNESTNAAAKYNTEARKTLTQTDDIGAKLEDVKRIGIEVASAIPAPFQEMQGALYDIFSSMDVSVKDSQVLLTAFSKAAVAGQTDLQTAARGTITILNAYKIPASQVNRVNDVMFQLVRKGVGTYDEFAKSIGRAIPSSVRAGQSFEQLAGMMAFMTRNGLSAQMAATSAARAFDALAHPKTVERMEDMGIKVRDANGQFRPMVDIVGQLSRKLSTMTAPEKAKALQELFKSSGGTIQARRFFDLAINNFDELNERVGEMKNSAGVAEEAYRIMFESPQAKMQMFNNQLDIMKVNVGEALLPMKLAMTEFATAVLNAFNKLDPKIQSLIVKIAAFAAAAAVVIGIVTAVVGGILMLAGAAALAGISFGAVIAIIAAIVVAIGVWVAAIIGIIKYHEQIKAFIMGVWESIRDRVMEVVEYFKTFAQEIVAHVMPTLERFWQRIQEGAQSAWSAIQTAFGYIQGAMQDLGAFIEAWHIDDFFIWLAQIIKGVLEVAIMSLVSTFRMLVDIIGGIVGPILDWIGQVFLNMAKIIAGVIKLVTGLLTGDWKQAWEGAKMIVEGITKMIISTVTNLLRIIMNTVEALAQGMYDRFQWMASRTLGTITGWVGNVIRWIASIPGKAHSAASGLINNMFNIALRAGQQMVNAIRNKTGELIGFVRSIPGRVRGALGNLGGLLFSAGRSIIQGLINGIKSAIGGVRSALGSVTGMIPDWKGPKQKDLKLLQPTGGWIMTGLITGFQKEIPELRRIMQGVTSEIGAEGIGTPRRIGSEVPAWAQGAQSGGVVVHQTVNTQEIDPRQHAAQLGYEVARRLSR